ncbi:hypothetical protein MP638_003953 [Amoeboaphelidium occidentale]|nr:hypothetical protein MP638_003953 [Amoeboaphelidium occidentale]
MESEPGSLKRSHSSEYSSDYSFSSEEESEIETASPQKTTQKRQSDNGSSWTDIGLNILKQHGWTEGEGLGKDKSGIVEPIKVEMRPKGEGLKEKVKPRKDRLQESKPKDRKKRKQKKNVVDLADLETEEVQILDFTKPYTTDPKHDLQFQKEQLEKQLGILKEKRFNLNRLITLLRKLHLNLVSNQKISSVVADISDVLQVYEFPEAQGAISSLLFPLVRNRFVSDDFVSALAYLSEQKKHFELLQLDFDAFVAYFSFYIQAFVSSIDRSKFEELLKVLDVLNDLVSPSLYSLILTQLVIPRIVALMEESSLSDLTEFLLLSEILSLSDKLFSRCMSLLSVMQLTAESAKVYEQLSTQFHQNQKNAISGLVLNRLLDLLSQFTINPAAQETFIIDVVIAWIKRLSKEHKSKIVSSVSRKWWMCLHVWLRSSSSEAMAEIAEWYETWKEYLPDEFDPMFQIGLDMMSDAMESQLKPLQKYSQPKFNPILSMLRTSSVTFKDAVEHFAQSHGLGFVPAPRKGCMIGTVHVMLDKDILYRIVQDANSVKQIPISLEELLELQDK